VRGAASQIKQRLGAGNSYFEPTSLVELERLLASAEIYSGHLVAYTAVVQHSKRALLGEVRRPATPPGWACRIGLLPCLDSLRPGTGPCATQCRERPHRCVCPAGLAGATGHFATAVPLPAPLQQLAQSPAAAAADGRASPGSSSSSSSSSSAGSGQRAPPAAAEAPLLLEPQQARDLAAELPRALALQLRAQVLQPADNWQQELQAAQVNPLPAPPLPCPAP
jgi:hypothetical protein